MTDCAAVYDASDSSSGQGGGICQNPDNTLMLTIDKCFLIGNTSGAEGGGIYAAGHMTLKNDSYIISNYLSHNTAANAAGVYLKNGKTLTIGSAERAKQALTDASTINNNFTAEGKASDLRLSVKDNKNAVNSVLVQCGLSGEILVVNAAIRMWSERVLPSVC